jgi:hypothetical protein
VRSEINAAFEAWFRGERKAFDLQINPRIFRQCMGGVRLG